MIFDAARSGNPGDRIAAIEGLASLEDPRATAQLAQLIHDPDPEVVRAAIVAAEHGGAEADRALTAIVNDPAATAELKTTAATQLRNRGAMLDDTTDRNVTGMLGPEYGGMSYGAIDGDQAVD